jgi:hypothetical protein
MIYVDDKEQKRGRTAMYTFSVYKFSDKEIDQICELTKRWAEGDRWRPLDARKNTKQVREYGIQWNLLTKEEGARLFLTSCISYCNKNNRVFNPRWDLPAEALWRLVEPMLRTDGSTGYSIVNNPLWFKNLAIAAQNQRGVTPQEMRDKEDILLELSGHHYINFQMAGNVWNITREDEQK